MSSWHSLSGHPTARRELLPPVTTPIPSHWIQTAELICTGLNGVGSPGGESFFLLSGTLPLLSVPPLLPIGLISVLTQISAEMYLPGKGSPATCSLGPVPLP